MAQRCFVVTGASSGLGEHFARSLAAEGHRVVMMARNRDALARIAQDIAATGGEAEMVAVDVTDASSVAAGFATIEGRIDVLVNNAGVGNNEPALATTPEGFDRVIDTNLRGVFLVAQAAAQRVARSPRGDGGTEVVYKLAVDLSIPMIGMLKRKAEKVIIDTALKNLKKRVESLTE